MAEGGVVVAVSLAFVGGRGCRSRWGFEVRYLDVWM